MRSTSRSRWVRAAGRGFALFALALATSGLGGRVRSERRRRPALRARHDAGRAAPAARSQRRHRPRSSAPATSACCPAPTRTRARPRSWRPGSPAPARSAPPAARPMRIARTASGQRDDPADNRCRGGFVCMWPMTVGTFACQKLCVCTDFVVRPRGASRSRPPASSGAALAAHLEGVRDVNDVGLPAVVPERHGDHVETKAVRRRRLRVEIKARGADDTGALLRRDRFQRRDRDPRRCASAPRRTRRCCRRRRRCRARPPAAASCG